MIDKHQLNGYAQMYAAFLIALRTSEETIYSEIDEEKGKMTDYLLATYTPVIWPIVWGIFQELEDPWNFSELCKIAGETLANSFLFEFKMIHQKDEDSLQMPCSEGVSQHFQDFIYEKTDHLVPDDEIEDTSNN